MKHIKKYALPVLCVLASLLLVLGCEDVNSNGDDGKDTTIPGITGPTIASQNATAATVDLTVNEDATLFWVLYKDTDPGHTTAAAVVTASADASAGVQRDDGDSATKGSTKSISLSGLSAGTYYFYVVARDAAGNATLGTKLEIKITSAVDTTGPTITGPTESGGGFGNGLASSTVDLTVNEDATLFWVLYKDTDPAHDTAAAVVSASADANAGVQRKNNDSATKGNEKSIDLMGLSAGTYYFYVVARDAANNDTLGTKLTISVTALTLGSDDTDNMGNLNVGIHCLRVYGENDCHSHNTSLQGGHIVGTVIAAGGDGSYTFSLTDDDEGKFSIESNSGNIALLQPQSDLTASTQFEITVRATDGNADTVDRTFTIANTGTTTNLGNLLFGDVSHKNGTEFTMINTDGADGSNNSIQINRTSGDWGGLFFNSISDVNLEGYQSFNMSYKVDSTEDDIGFEVKLESSASACDNDEVMLNRSGNWEDASIALTDFTQGEVSGNACTSSPDITLIDNPGIWTIPVDTNNGVTGMFLIDEIYFSQALAAGDPANPSIAPSFTNNTPSIDMANISVDSADATVQVNEQADIYWVVYATEQTGATADTVIGDANDSDDTNEVDAGILMDVQAFSVNTTFTIEDLMAGQPYYLYVVAQDDDDNKTLATPAISFSTPSSASLEINTTSFDVGHRCLRIHGDQPCHAPVDTNSIAAGDFIGTVSTSYDGTAPVSYSVNDATTISINNMGELSFAVANPDFGASGITVMVTATDNAISDTQAVTVTNIGTTTNLPDGAGYQMRGAHPNSDPKLVITNDSADGIGGTGAIDIVRSGIPTNTAAGIFFNGVTGADITAYNSVNVSYKVAAGDGVVLRYKIEDSSGVACEHNVQMVKDGMWNSASLPLSNFFEAPCPTNLDGTATQNPGLWTFADGSISLDEYYYSTAPATNVAPYFNDQPASTVGATDADVTVTVNEPAKLYWVVYETANIPASVTAASIITDSDTGGVARGVVATVAADNEHTIEVTSLDLETGYTIYVVAEELGMNPEFSTLSSSHAFMTSGHNITITTTGFDIGSTCYRVYGEVNCGSAIETLVNDTPIGTVSATHSDTTNGSISYSITGDSGDFVIDAASGVITFSPMDDADETVSSTTMYTITISASDPMDSSITAATQTITITNMGNVMASNGDYGIWGAAGEAAVTEEMDGANSTKSLQIVRPSTASTPFGPFFTSVNGLDVSGYGNINFSYKVASDDPATELLVRLQTGDAQCDIETVTLTKDGMWTTASIALTDFTSGQSGFQRNETDMACASFPMLNSITNPAFLENSMNGGTILIDEIYFD